MDVDQNLETPRPTRDADGNAIWEPLQVSVLGPSGHSFQSTARSPIRFRDIALLLFGGIIGGAIVGFLAVIGVHEFTRSQFVTVIVGGTSLYGSLIWGYHWIAQERDWIGIRQRFTPVGRWPLILGALAAPALIAVTASLGWIVQKAGIKLAQIPEPQVLPHGWVQLPFALFLIAIIAPVCEELLFRGLLLDWLKQKINVWIAAVILSVIFSLLHANPFSLGAVGWLAFSHRFLIGITASALAIRYRSLLPSFALHATVNGIACLAAMVE
jgi:membrane protease YdiL (CAAX protease family)